MFISTMHIFFDDDNPIVLELGEQYNVEHAFLELQPITLQTQRLEKAIVITAKLEKQLNAA